MSAPQPGPETWSSPAQPAYGPPVPAPAPSARRSPLAVTSFATGVATVLVGAVVTLAFPVVLSSSGYSPTSVSVLQLVNGVLAGLLGLAAVITGAVALVRRLPGTALAAAGTALGAAALLGFVLSLVQGALYQVL
jgi:nitrate reductase gamma subunit